MKTNFSPKSQAISAMRKIWRNSPLRKCALEMNCATPFEIQKKRLYKCGVCKKVFLAQQIEVDHKNACPHDDLDFFLDSMLCEIVKIKKGQDDPMHLWVCELKNGECDLLENIINENLQILCIDCHKEKTKADRKKISDEKKSRKISTKR